MAPRVRETGEPDQHWQRAAEGWGQWATVLHSKGPSKQHQWSGGDNSDLGHGSTLFVYGPCQQAQARLEPASFQRQQCHLLDTVSLCTQGLLLKSSGLWTDNLQGVFPPSYLTCTVISEA